MKDILDFLKKNSAGFLATVDGDKAKGRPFQFMFMEDGRFYFCTSNKKKVFKQMKANPWVEFSSMSPDCTSWVRLSGEIKFIDDKAIKERILMENPLVKSIYKTADNPEFEAFCIEHGKALMEDFSGRPPKITEF